MPPVLYVISLYPLLSKQDEPRMTVVEQNLSNEQGTEKKEKNMEKGEGKRSPNSRF